MFYAFWDLGRPHIPNSSVILFLLGVQLLILGFLSDQVLSLKLLRTPPSPGDS